MESKIKDLRQLIFNFGHNKSFQKNDFFISESNYFAYELLMSWPKWEKKLINIYGAKSSGKTHLLEIFKQKNRAIKFDAMNFNKDDLDKTNLEQNIILENLDTNFDENLIYTLVDLLEKQNKYLIITSKISINLINVKLPDLKSRFKNCLNAEIKKPDDLLLQALIIKNLSDHQIILDSKLINFICKRITRSYDNITEFICTIDKISLKKKKPISLKIIKEILK